MSYDLMVFNPKAAPRSESDFLKWYAQQTEWEEKHTYDDPKVTTVELQNWFMEMITQFPAMNGPYAIPDIEDRIDEEVITEYCIGRDLIYTGFRWSITEKAYPKMYSLAEKYKVGFFDPSGDGNILFPNENGILVSINKNTKSKPWWKFW